ncbi:MAG: cystathionine gamma-synthase [Actinobacteria bacterium]|nr:cystathionine gamma-synthase [Actinomycetota bacterium]
MNWSEQVSEDIRFETVAIHVGQDPDPTTGSAVVPIYQTSTYVQQAVGAHKGFEYSRTDNPTRRALEICLAALEGTEHCVSFASGMAAITTLAMTLSSGARVLIPDDVYGGTHRLFAKVFNQLGLSFEAVDMTDLATVAAACDAGVELLIAETPTNPLLKILDLAELARLGHDAGALVVVDNTFATPYIQRPLDFGADAVVYSATKYLGGHSDLVMGAVATGNDDLAERLRFLQNAVGAVPGPMDCWLLLRGLKTLAVRMRAHCEGAERVAVHLESHPAVTRVHYPGSPGFPGHDVAARQMAGSGTPLYGGMVGFEVAAEDLALAVCSRTKLFWLGESLGGVESLIEHPGKMTHASLIGSGFEVSDSLVRLSVGIEHPDDLTADLDQALSAG